MHPAMGEKDVGQDFGTYKDIVEHPCNLTCCGLVAASATVLDGDTPILVFLDFVWQAYGSSQMASAFLAISLPPPRLF